MSKPAVAALGLLAVVVAALATVAVQRGTASTPSPAATTRPAPAPTPSRSPLLPALARPPTASPGQVAARLAPLLADPAIAGSVAASVVDVASGAVLLDVRAGDPVIPASTAKLATAVAVLTALAPDARLVTRVVAGPVPGSVVLVGGGDVTLAGPKAVAAFPGAARIADLAAQTRSALGVTAPTQVLVDDTAYTGPASGPGWRPGYVTGGAVAPVSALSVDGGRRDPAKADRVPDPAAAAGAALAAALGAPQAPVSRGVATPGAAELARVGSAPVTDLVELMLHRSDNDLAESLSRQVAIARGAPASFDGARSAVRQVLTETGTPAPIDGLVDGSGLSRDNRVRPAAITALLARVAADRGGRLAPLLSGLPVGGFDGTLADRYRAGAALPAAGNVRAKTGTLEGVSALAGLARTADGSLVAFDVTANAVAPGATGRAEAALDRVAAALAGCGCP